MILDHSGIWTPKVIEDIHVKAQLGRYRISAFSTKQSFASFDDLVFLATGLTRFPLEGYKEKCETRTIIGKRYAKNPLILDIPIYISGMSTGALSQNAKIALGLGAAMVGTANTTGDGGMLIAERRASKKLIYQVLPSRYGFNPSHLRMAEGIEIVIGQGAKPATGGLLMGQKTSRKEIADMRDIPMGIDQRSAVRHPDWLGPDDLSIKIEELREATDWNVPISVKLPACRVKDDVKLAAKAGADAIVIDGFQAGTAASSEIVIDHSGIPTMPAIVLAREALKEIGLYGEITLIASGGIRNGADLAKAIALGADAVAIGQAAIIALNCNREIPGITNFVKEIGVQAGYCNKCNTGLCPVGIATQNQELEKRLDSKEAGKRLANFLNACVMEATLIARSLGKGNIHSLEPEDLASLTLEASLMSRIPLVGTDKVPHIFYDNK